jgi:O-antigen/teichoic acid export membrane protein
LGIAFLLLISKAAEWYILASFISSAATLILAIIFYFGKERIDPRFFSKAFLKESIKFGIPLQFMEFNNLLIKFADRYLLQILIGFSAVGIYDVGASVAAYIQEIIFSPMNLAVFPLIMQIYKKKGLADTEAFISRVSNYLWIISIPIIFGISMLKEEIVVILASEKYIETSAIMPYAITGAILWGFCRLYAAGLHIAKKTKKFAAIISMGMVLNVVLNVVLIRMLSITGAAIATLITYVILLGLTIKVSFVHLKIKFYPWKVVKAIFASALMCLIISAIHLNIPLLQLLVRIFTGSVVYFMFMIVLDSDLRNIAKRFFTLYFLPLKVIFLDNVNSKGLSKIFKLKK